MKCDELDRYLETFLDGRMSRAHGAALRKHLVACAGCRGQVDRLKQFERDINRRLRAMHETPSLWSDLELDLVRSAQLSLPPGEGQLKLLPPPRVAIASSTDAKTGRGGSSAHVRARRKHQGGGKLVSNLVAIAIMLAATGALVSIARGLVANEAEVSAATAYEAFVQGNTPVQLETDDAQELQGWFSERFSRSFPLPPVPEGFALRGGAIGEVEGRPTAFVVYEGASPTLLMINPLPRQLAPREVATTTVTSQEDEVAVMSWRERAYEYTLVSELGLDQVDGFASRSADAG